MNTRTTPKDFFLHLGATIALYASAIALMNLAFESINRALPDALSNYFNAGSVVWPISMLIVLAPVLYAIEWLIGRDISKMIEKKDVWIRRWRIYLTLFLTGATIAGDLIALINTYLNGEITSRFIFKVLVVFIVSAVIFAFYLLERATDSPKKMKWKNILAWLGIILVISGIVIGFIIVGSPAKQRALHFDQQRAQDLFVIQSKVIAYWIAYGSLPQSLDQADAMNPASTFGSRIAVDPVTNVPYEYSKKSDRTYEICAIFSVSSDEIKKSQNMPVVPDTNLELSWDHGVGRTCFARSVDTSRYPLAPNSKSII
jgi:hypothetical protein